MKKHVAKTLLTSLLFSTVLAPNPVLAQSNLKSRVKQSTTSTKTKDKSDSDQTKDKETPASKIDYSQALDPILEMLTPASHELVYESKEPIEVSSPDGDLVTRVDGYQYYTMEDFEYNARISFDNQNEKGGFIITHWTMENNSDQDVYYSGDVINFKFAVTDEITIHSNDRDFMDDESGLFWDYSDRLIEPGKTKSGFIIYNVKPNVVDALEELPVIQLEIPGFAASSDLSDKVFPTTKVNLSFSDSQDEDIRGRDELLPDKFLADNMGTKKMIKDVQVEDAYISIEPENVSYGIDSYQVSEFIPNALYEEALEEFEDGLVIINIPLKVTNDGWEDGINISSLTARLVLDNLVELSNNLSYEVGPQLLNSDGQTELVKNSVFKQRRLYDQVLDVGESGVYYLTFTIDGSLYKRFEGAGFSLSVSIRDDKGRSLDVRDYAVEVDDSNRVE